MSQDKQLQQAVLAELEWKPSVIAAHIGVTANAGVVCLTGHVESLAQKHAAESTVRRVKNVKGVAAEIEVRLPFDKRRDDEVFAVAAIDRLAWDVSVRPDTIKVEVDQGWVTLTGQIDWHYEKNAAERDIRGLVGVIGVINQILIKPKVSVTNISDDIRSAMHRSRFDSDAIMVSADGGDIRLTGTVHSWHDRLVAGATARAAQGATAVRNDIEVV